MQTTQTPTMAPTMAGPTPELRAAYETACERDRDAWNAYQTACAAYDAAWSAPITDTNIAAWRAAVDETRIAADAASAEWWRLHREEHALYVRVMAAYGYAEA